jgi:hypothetical protein
MEKSLIEMMALTDSIADIREVAAMFEREGYHVHRFPRLLQIYTLVPAKVGMAEQLVAEVTFRAVVD